MSFWILYKDEMKGFYKSKVMIVLWIGLPLLSILMHLINPNLEGVAISSFVALLVASIGGTLSSVMLSTNIVSERNQHVYDLFLIRPVKRYNLILSKYFAVLSCLFITTLLTIIIGGIIDKIKFDINFFDLLDVNLESLGTTVSGIAIACSVGVLFGMMVSSVPLAAILSVYLGNQLTSIILLPPIFLDGINMPLYLTTIGIAVPVIILGISILIFNKKQL